mgnify:CR=1 FL=1
MSMSLRAYARHRGVALSAVQKAIATGRIQTEANGTIDPVKADAQWDQHTRTSQPTTPKVVTSQVVTPKVVTPQVVSTERAAVLSTPPTASFASSTAPNDEARGVDYNKARAVRETYAARLAKLDFEERTGKLLNADEVQVKHFNLARQLRERIQQIPRKVAPDLIALVVVNPDLRSVIDILDTAIREALEDLTR